MTKKLGKKHSLMSSPAFQGATLREETVGRRHVNSSAMLRMQHLQRLAIWAAGEASIPPLGAVFGHRLAANAEAEGIPLDRSIFSCQRCETILQPGYNCTIRIEKNASEARRHRKCGILQNNVVYTCHFCSHRNLRKGTTKGHMKDLLSSTPRSISALKHADSIPTTVNKAEKDESVSKELNTIECVSGYLPFNVKCSLDKEVAADIPAKGSPMTPSDKISEKKMKISSSGSSKASCSGPNYVTTGSGKDSGISSKRKRRGWSGLREITLSSEREKEQQKNSLVIPFLM